MQIKGVLPAGPNTTNLQAVYSCLFYEPKTGKFICGAAFACLKNGKGKRVFAFIRALINTRV
jgi:hypothetical protein